MVARCNNREFSFTTPEDFEVLLAHLREMVRTYEVTLYGYTLMSNHVHLLLQAPKAEALGRPLRWFMTETSRAFHRVRGRRGHFWERRYRSAEPSSRAQAEGLVTKPVVSHRGRHPQPRCAPIRRSERCPGRPCEGSHDLSLVKLCGVCPGCGKSRDHLPSQLPGPESLREGAPAAVPHLAGCQQRSPGRCPRSPLDDPARRRPSWRGLVPDHPVGQELEIAPRRITGLGPKLNPVPLSRHPL